MKLKDYLDIDKLANYIDEGIVGVRQHPTLPLDIYCYTRTATYDNIWNDVTGKARGLIVDRNTDEIIARPFEKFFNFETEDKPETHFSNIPKTEPIWLDKLDGSLGILWQYPIKSYTDENGTKIIEGDLAITGIASKGSFTSDYAEWATHWYHTNVQNPIWPKGYTPIFEMICQAIQTHVVLYDIPDQLILTALINNETGEELDYNTLYHYAKLNGLNVVEIYNFQNDDSVRAALKQDRPNKEGYVASWPRLGQPPLKVKFKHQTFLKLQKIVHAATPKKILEALTNKDYEVLQTWEDGLSFELAEYVRGWRDKFTEAYSRVLLFSKTTTQHLLERYQTRKQMASFIFSPLKPDTKKYSSVIFAMLDGQEKLERNLENVSKAAWKIVAEDFKDELLKVREEE